jgi:DNA (cytosine-5)-methyltransferase 1
VKVGSLFSGIGGFDLGLTFPVSWQVEMDKDCNRVLAHHFPEAERFNNVKEVGKANLAAVDLICGGFPCQDLSVAGKRAGLDGERSGLWFEFHRIIRELSPQWVLIENVPGLLSSNGGRDFAIILSGLAELGYGAAWRILDAQYFGVPQRRRRVFIVASLGDGRAAQVLFEPSCGCGDTPPGREAGEGFARDVAPSLSASGRGTSRAGESRGQDPLVMGFKSGQSAQARSLGIEEELSPSLEGGGGGNNRPCVAIQDARAMNKAQNGFGISEEDVSYTLDSTGSQGIAHKMFVRRLTPTECLRLQGFPDNYLDLTPPLSDSAKYRMTGNAVAVPVINWLGLKIRESSI